jgi:hypothetical protein
VWQNWKEIDKKVAEPKRLCCFFVYRKPPVRPGVPKSFSDESLMVYKNLLG